MSETHLTHTRFDDFALDGRVLQGIAEAGFQFCTPIQAHTLPIALEGRDVAGQAQTGTGKTAAFLIAVFQNLLQMPAREGRRPNHPRALILAPTRELAVQIHHDAEKLARYLDFRLVLVFGGTGYEQQRLQLEAGVDILIGTPGRLIDYHKQHIFDLRAIQAVVLDEADRMFDLGFIKDIRYLLKKMPPPTERLGMLFSATLSYRVTELAYEHMNHPELIKIEAERVTAEKVRQTCYMTANEEKIPLLLGLMRSMAPSRSIVFVNTKRGADMVWGYLEGNGVHAEVLSGDVPQNKRLRLMQDFQAGKLPVLVATDVAARGLHIPDVTHVFNFDLPEDAEDYVHRIGRTARAGAAGDAISFVCETYAFSMPDIEQFIGHRIPVEPVASDLLVHVSWRSMLKPEGRLERRDGRGGRGGHAERGGRGEGRHGGRSSHAEPHASDRPPAETPPAQRQAAPSAAPVAEQAVPVVAAATDSPQDAQAPKKRRRRRRPKAPGASAEHGAVQATGDDGSDE